MVTHQMVATAQHHIAQCSGPAVDPADILLVKPEILHRLQRQLDIQPQGVIIAIGKPGIAFRIA